MSHPIQLELHEYDSKTVLLSDEQAKWLSEVGRGAITVEIDSQASGYKITTQSMVGTLLRNDLHILIRPKIKPENLFLLLEVGLPHQAWRQEAYDYATNADLLPSIVAFYARTLETTLARGLLHSYRHKEDRLVALRGRIDMAAQFRQAGIRVPVACRYDEYTPDNAENRYLKAAVRLALRVPQVPPEDHSRLLRQAMALEDVTDATVRADDLEQIAFTRLNAHYEPALRLARLLLGNLTLRDQHGDRSASSFLVDMNKLFEDFVTQRLKRALAGRLLVYGQYPTHLDTNERVRIQPDLAFKHHDEEVFVGDIKYKLIKDGGPNNNDYYQLLAYTTALNLPKGVLIYCRDANKDINDDLDRTLTVRHADKTLHTLAVNLSGSPQDVDNEIKKLADWIENQAGVRVGHPR